MAVLKSPKCKITLALFLVAALWPYLAFAIGTPAGTVISNQASIGYTIADSTVSHSSNTVDIEVQECIDVELSWNDSNSVVVSQGDTGRLLTFLLSNTGNGPEAFRVLSQIPALAATEFSPANGRIYLDLNGNGTFEAATDPFIASGTTLPPLAADEHVYLFLVHDIPAGATDGSEGPAELTAIAASGSAPPGTALPGAGVNGLTAVLGPSGGSARSEGRYQVSAVEVLLHKSAQIHDGPGGTTDPVSRAYITYTIDVDITGSGTVTDLVITDPVPAGTILQPGSLRLDGTLLSDTADGDAGEYFETPAGSGTYSLVVRLGDVTAPATRRIAFTVQIP